MIWYMIEWRFDARRIRKLQLAWRRGEGTRALTAVVVTVWVEVGIVSEGGGGEAGLGKGLSTRGTSSYTKFSNDAIA